MIKKRWVKIENERKVFLKIDYIVLLGIQIIK